MEGFPALQGRGRGRGRGRGNDPSQNVQHGIVPGMAALALVPQTIRPVAPSSTVAPRHADASAGISAGSSNGGGHGNGGHGSNGGNGAGAGGDVGRGSMRSRRLISCSDMVKSRPDKLESKKGSFGREIALKANYFRLIRAPKWCLYQYRVDFSPDIEVTRQRVGLLSSQKAVLGGYLFDGTMLFIAKRLQQDVVELVTRDRNESEVLIKIKFVGMISMLEDSSLQIMNLILKRSMNGLQLQQINGNFYDPVAKVDIREYALQLWPGYKTSIRQHEHDLLLNSEIAHKVMRLQTLLEMYQKCRQNARSNDEAIENYRRAVIGMTVLTDYNNKTYRIDDIDWTKTPTSTFETKQGVKSFVEYYKTRYNLTISDLRQPLLVSSLRSRDVRGNATEPQIVCLVPELCRATGLDDEMRDNFRLMRALSDHTRLMPEPRIRKLIEFNRRLQTTPASVEVLTEWQMRLDQNLVELTGRHLPQEKIKFGGNSVVSAGPEADWTRSFRNIQLYKVIELKRWTVITTQRMSNETEQFIKILKDVARGMSFPIAQPTVLTLGDDRIATYTNSIEQSANADPQLIMCILPIKREDRYSAIKKKCCVDRAIPTQIMLQKTINPRGGPGGLMSVATKVAIQLNCKLGGAPWMCDVHISGLMTIGYDVCHDSINKSKSYGALVASMDLQKFPKFFSAVNVHTNNEEMSNYLIINVNKALQEYRKLSGGLPSRIMFYRDGVGDGQLGYIYEHEVELMRSKLEMIYASASLPPPKFAFIVVSKRISTRLFAGNQNPPPGTVVDDVITLPERYDFFVVSQAVRQGTVTPTNYNVLYDTSGLPADKIQRFTYMYCHMYYNWSGTTRVPAVCQYAHKLAFLVAKYIKQCPSALMDKQLYFL